MASYCGGCLQNKVTSPALPTPRDLFCGSAHGHAGGLSGLLCKSGAHKRRQSAITSLVVLQFQFHWPPRDLGKPKSFQRWYHCAARPL